MIPKKAFFTWVGSGDLPWLREMSIETFRRCNPDWDTSLIRLASEEKMLPAHVTDIARYEHLAEHGGLYFDTDIVFFRPVPELMLDCHLLITIDKEPFQYDSGNPYQNQIVEHMPGFNNLAMMGAVPGSKFFSEMHDVALRRKKALMDDDVDISNLMYQAFGTALMNRHFYARTEEAIAKKYGPMVNIPLDMVLPIPWYDSHKLFNGTPFEPPETTIGVHWYGGCLDAKMYQRNLGPETFHRRRCYLTEAIERALA